MNQKEIPLNEALEAVKKGKNGYLFVWDHTNKQIKCKKYLSTEATIKTMYPYFNNHIFLGFKFDNETGIYLVTAEIYREVTDPNKRDEYFYNKHGFDWKSVLLRKKNLPQELLNYLFMLGITNGINR